MRNHVKKFTPYAGSGRRDFSAIRVHMENMILNVIKYIYMCTSKRTGLRTGVSKYRLYIYIITTAAAGWVNIAIFRDQIGRL